MYRGHAQTTISVYCSVDMAVLLLLDGDVISGELCSVTAHMINVLSDGCCLSVCCSVSVRRQVEQNIAVRCLQALGPLLAAMDVSPSIGAGLLDKLQMLSMLSLEVGLSRSLRY